MKKILEFFLHRLVIVAFLLLLQFIILISMIVKFNDYFIYFYFICVLISLYALLYIINNKSNPAYKMAWIVPILIFPIFGGLFYLILSGNKLSKHKKKRMQAIRTKMKSINYNNEQTLENLKKENIVASKQARYMQTNSYSPVYDNNYTEYYSTGEEMYESLKKELLKAKKFIFLEFFIIEEGIMWNSILDILVKKVREGVDVRVIYDDMGCVATLPYKYFKKLKNLGIKCCVFNPLIPILSSKMNNRDHRKIVVIDGFTGFTGGVNLSDRYINISNIYGHWKDSAIMIKGESVWNLTVMFLSMWDYISKKRENYEQYFPNNYVENKIKFKGYVQPYNDSPLDEEKMGESVYLNMINNANKYIYITTPYLIIDNEMLTALSLAVKSGIDVRIIVPGIPDKKIVYQLTKSYCQMLVEIGVKVYEYSSGFIHSKNFVVDDTYATVGTINLDYRSLYLHFECGVWLYNTTSVLDIKRDFEETLKSCKQITLKELQKVSSSKKLFRAILRLFAPLM